MASSSLFVGNLPSDIEEAELRAVFEGIGAVKEVVMKKNRSGPYSFIHMEREEDAEVALSSLNLFKIRDGT